MKSKLKQSVFAVQIGENVYKIEKAVNLLIRLGNYPATYLQELMDKGVQVSIGKVR